MDPTSLAVGGGIGLVGGVVLMLVWVNTKASGVGGMGKLFAVADRAKQDAAFAAKLQAVLGGAEIKPVEPPKPPKPSGAPLWLLAVLQAEARLVDFLMDDFGPATENQIANAAREVNKKGQAALKRHAVVETVLSGNEGDSVTVPKGFDPSAIRVIGNVTGDPPFTGSINHPGWRVKELKLAPPPEGADEFVLQPAEVQIA